MKLAVLIALVVVIITAAFASYIHFRQWNETRYDDLIDAAAKRHDVDPALVKALYRTQLRYLDRMPEGLFENSHGPMHIREGTIELRRRYICPARPHPNHDPSKPEEFTSDQEGTCQAKGCGQTLVQELNDPETNFDIACALLKNAEKLIIHADPGLENSAAERLRRVICAYRFGLDQLDKTPVLNATQEAFVDEVLDASKRYRKAFPDRPAR